MLVVSTLSFVSINLCLCVVSFTKVSVKNRPSNKTVLENVAIPVKLSTDCDVSVGIEKTKLLLSNPVKFKTNPAEIVTDFG